MESIKELTMKKGKRVKLPTKYPKIIPTYVVAFAVQETLDDPQKLQQITNKRSENSTPRVSPTDSNNSAKTFTSSSPTEPSLRDTLTLSEVKIDILDDYQCGDVVEKKSLQISSFVILDNRSMDEGQLEILFNVPKHTKRYKDSTRFTSKKRRKSKKVFNFKKVHFKYKKPIKCITRSLEKYYEKTKSNTPNSEQIQDHCNVLLKVVSRSRVLRKVLAKENLFADSDQISILDGVSIFDYDNGSMNSSPSSTRKSFISYTSQKTLVQINSASSRNEDFSSLKTADSNITVASNKQSPYKSEIINVSLAVTFNGSKTNTSRISTSSNETLTHKKKLTSSETFLHNNTTDLTSKPPSSDEQNYKIDYNDLTSTTINLNEKVQTNENEDVKAVLEVRSEDDTFVVAQTSSDFNKSSMYSACTLTMNSETTLPVEDAQSSFPSNGKFENNFSNKTTTLDKVRFLGFYPIKTPSVDSSAKLCCDLNDVLVTDSSNMANSFPLKSENISPTDTQKASVLQKPIDLNNMTYLQTNISLPNDVTIKAKLKEVKEARRSCPDSVRNKYPTDMADMWERLTIVLDFAVKRLEDTLANKIIKEIKESLATFNQPECKAQTVQLERVETTVAPVTCDRPIPTMLHKEIFVKENHLKRDADISMQCDLVQRQVLDQLMVKLSAEPPIPSSGDGVKVLQSPELLKDHLEVLKSPVDLAKESASMEAGKVDTVTVSTATTAISRNSGLYKFKHLVEYPATFLRENTLVISSVPTFLIVMFCIYGIIMLILNP